MNVNELKDKIRDLMEQEKELESRIPVIKKMSLMNSYPHKVRQNFQVKYDVANKKLRGIKLHLSKFRKELKSKKGQSGKVKLLPGTVVEEATLKRW